ncbi:MAG TPA: polyprenyl synthetase family protein [Polyangiales bacterium]|nr:polyprenyl synthetase family protein [Polyangiales bacterium]
MSTEPQLATRTEPDLGAYLSDCRELALGEIRRMVPRDDPHANVLYDLMLDYPMRGAKGLRPTLCIAACRALGGGIEAVLPSAALVELYHNAFLIHDDIEDGSEQRRDRPTLHRMHGVPIAINVGDGMLALALAPLLENTRVVGLGPALRIMQTVSRMARETAEGQAIELDWIRRDEWRLDDDDYRRMVVKKTGWYSFMAPVAIGAIVAGASAGQIEALTDMARELSIAFQIQDDILNLKSSAIRYGKEVNGDLWEGKRTLILLHALRTISPDERTIAIGILSLSRPTHRVDLESTLAELQLAGEISTTTRDRILAALGCGAYKTAHDIDALRRWIADTDSIAYAERICRYHAEQSRAALARVDGLSSSAHSDVLHALIDFTIEREH